VAYLAGGAVGCGAVRLLGDGAAEIKRMFVRPDARGRGISRRILEALEGEARAMGAVRVLLETGERQPAALGLYESAGYVRVKAFGEYVGDPFSLCMAKELV
jgi:GNAT superfamily N-acetyltransferase